MLWYRTVSLRSSYSTPFTATSSGTRRRRRSSAIRLGDGPSRFVPTPSFSATRPASRSISIAFPSVQWRAYSAYRLRRSLNTPKTVSRGSAELAFVRFIPVVSHPFSAESNR